MEHESNCDTNCNSCARYSHQTIGTGAGEHGNNGTSGNHSNYNIIKISQNTVKSPGDLKKLAVTQTQLENH